MKEKPPLREVLWGSVKYSSPRHAEKCSILPSLSERGRYFFHGGSLEVAVVAVECLDETDTPMPRVSAWLRHSWVVAGTASEKSHVIRLGEVSIESENVAIPTL